MTDEMSAWADGIMRQKYLHKGEESWADIANRVVREVVGPFLPDLVKPIAQAVTNRELMPGGRFLAQAGNPIPMTNNCFLMRAEDSREGWAEIMRKMTMASMQGGGVGIVYSDLRGNGAKIRKTGGVSSGPLALMHMVNEAGRHIQSGGNRRAALWAGLHWWHPDVFAFIEAKDWSDSVRAAKEEDFFFPAPLDGTNISVILDDTFFDLLEGRIQNVVLNPKFGTVTRDAAWAQRVYDETVKRMVTTAEPGFSVDTGANKAESLRNPCCEITSEDPDDVCCLGSINLARVRDEDHMRDLVSLGTAFLLCGTLYSSVPYPEVEETRQKNRRLGLGVMGVHEWLLANGKDYGPDEDLARYMEIYETSTEVAGEWADKLGVSRPVKTRAIAPTGTIGILAQTTTGIEPLFAAAYKRRYVGSDGTWKFQYVVDATAQRISDKYGVDLDSIYTAYELAKTPEKRLEFQAWMQQYVDHAISSTINLPRVEDHAFTVEDFSSMLRKYLPKLRGITCYPDGARGGQPLNVVPYSEAWVNEGTEFSEDGLDQACVSGVCGT